MPRITISINASGEPNDQELLTLDLPPGLTVADLKAMVEAEASFPANTQSFFFNGEALRNDAQTLEQAGIKDGEMLAMMVNRRSGQQQVQQRRTRNGVSSQPENLTPERIEDIRQQILANPQQMSGLIQQQPELAAAINDGNRFRNLWMGMLDSRDREQRERENQMALLNEDPFNPDAQKKIEEMIRREKIEANLQYAYENNPEVFGRVSMLYVDTKVNGHSIKAFVDSGAQTTIMSPSCAESCGISYLIDERFGGIARGVGTAKILGRVHNAKIQIGDAELDCAFTVMEGKDVDLLFGLDMLRRHQACIDLKANELRFPHTKVNFLPESEIPKKWEEAMVDEPTVPGPNGTEIGAKTGAVRPEGTAQAAHQNLHPNQSASAGASSSAGKQPSPAPSSAAAAGPSNTSRPAPAAQPESKYGEQMIGQLVSLGFSRPEAIQALEATDGNVELAAGLLFQ